MGVSVKMNGWMGVGYGFAVIVVCAINLVLVNSHYSLVRRVNELEADIERLRPSSGIGREDSIERNADEGRDSTDRGTTEA
jgi:hypothetical protein